MAKKKATQTGMFAPGTFADDARIEVGLARPPADPNYQPPDSWPNFGDLPSRARVTLDAETHDPDLRKTGTKVMRGDAYVVGWGMQIEDEAGDPMPYAEYYPMRHDYGPNCDPEKVEAYLRDNLAKFRGTLTGANSNLYDGQYMHQKGILAPHAKWRDVQWSEALIDEESNDYSLEGMCRKYGIPGKVKDDLTLLYGKNWIAHWREVHPSHGRDYVLGDVDRPSRILDKQLPILEAEGLTALNDMESRLVPFLHYLREHGVRVDLGSAENFNDDLILKRDAELQKLSAAVGFAVDYDNFQQKNILKQIFDTLGVRYPYTAPSKNYPNGQPSFTGAWLDGLTDPAAANLSEARTFEKARSTFVEGYLINSAIGNRVHCEFHPLRRNDENGKHGTVSGRFSSSNPNLQNIPSRDPYLGPLLRAMFLPNEGCDWWSLDYSQIEYRFLVHFAMCMDAKGLSGEKKDKRLAAMASALQAGNMYIKDPGTDFHMAAAILMAEALTKVLWPNGVFPTFMPDGKTPFNRIKWIRGIAKNINFGLVYGMGKDKLAVSLGMAEWKDGTWVATQAAIDILDTFHANNPYIRELTNLCTSEADELGYITTILGRRSRFNLWEPKKWSDGFNPGYPYDEAVRIYGNNLKRSGTYKALNRRLQGSAADLMKLAMVNIWESGVLSKGNDIWCHLTVHDELDGSLLPTNRGRNALAEIRNMMNIALPLKIPVMTSGTTGANWHEAH